MFDRILVAIDDSPEAERAVVTAGRLATAQGGEILVVHAHEIPVALTMGVPSDASSLVEQSQKDSETMVAQAVSTIHRLGVQSAGRVLIGPGSVAMRVLEAACEFEADLVVVGTRGPTDIQGLLLGSVVHDLLHISDCAVLVVPPPVRNPSVA